VSNLVSSTFPSSVADSPSAEGRNEFLWLVADCYFSKIFSAHTLGRCWTIARFCYRINHESGHALTRSRRGTIISRIILSLNGNAGR
jgi:hypothetical protein